MGYIVCREKPKHLYSPKTYICMWRTINRQKKNHIKNTKLPNITIPLKQTKKIKHNKNKKETQREPENAKERIKTNNCEFCRRKILEYLKKAK